MRTGRPPAGLDHVDMLSGDDATKERLRVLLATLLGPVTIDEAGAMLGVGPSRVHALRQRALQGALTALARKRPGRPRRESPPVDPQHVAELEQELRRLRLELDAQEVRAELASLAKPPAAAEKKNRSKRKSGGRPLRRPRPRGSA